jgi:cytochrome c5
MSSTWTMWLGISFVVLAIAAVILQAWLWSFPMDPPDDPKGRSLAPRAWTNLHRVVGLLYVTIYVVMMTQMIPRLWQYQVELPARTVMHAVMGLTIGVLLVTKFSIIRFFKHFGKSLPAIGLGILLCTIILGALSIPFAVRAHALGKNLLEPQNKERVMRILADLELPGKPDVAGLVTQTAFSRGQKILTGTCTTCHDLRTILIRPRTGKQWLDVVSRMAEKPSFGDPIGEMDIPFVTAYLIALTPQLQESMQAKVAEDRARDKQVAEVKAITGGGPTPAVDATKSKALYEEKCGECHKLTKVDKHGGDDEAGWTQLITRMIEENEAELSAEDVKILAAYLASTKAK